MNIRSILTGAAAIAVGCGFATDLRWVNWNGDLKASTAANWDPQQVPVEGDNLIIDWGGSGTKYWHNDLSVVYGHITASITNSSGSRIDFDQNEVRVSNGIEVIGKDGTFYPRTAITGTGDFVVDFPGGTCYLPTSPSSGRYYSGDFHIRHGNMSASAANVTGSEASHGNIYIYANSTRAGEYGKLDGPAGNVYNDIYYDNTCSVFAFQPAGNANYYGNLYFTGGGGTLQKSGDQATPVNWYGKWIKWVPEGRTARSDTLRIYTQRTNYSNGGINLYGGYEDPDVALSLWDGANCTCRISSKIDVPHGINLIGTGLLRFGIDNCSDTALPLYTGANTSIIDLCGTRQTFGDFTVKAGTTPIITNSVAGGEFVWAPSEDATFPGRLDGDYAFTFNTNGVTGTIGSGLVSELNVGAGTLVVAAGSSLPDVKYITVDSGAKISIATEGIFDDVQVTVDDASGLEIAADTTFTAYKVVVGGYNLTPGSYSGYGEGTLVVKDPLFVWTGEGGDNDPTNPDNWNYGVCPESYNSVRFAALSPDTPIALNGDLAIARCEIAAGTTVQLGNGVELAAAEFTFGSGAKVTSSGAATLKYTSHATITDVPVEGEVTVALVLGADFTSTDISARGLRLSNSYEIVLPGDISVYSYEYNGVYQNPGLSSTGVTGGYLNVFTNPGAVAAEWSVWTGGAGAEDISVYTDANWQDGIAPDFSTGAAKLRFPANAVVDVPSGTVRVYELDFLGAAVISNSVGIGRMLVGAGGAAACAKVEFCTPVEFTAAPQAWRLDGASAKVVFNDALGASDMLGNDGMVYFLGNGNAGVKYGLGQVTFNMSCESEMSVGVCVSNLLPIVNQGAAFSATRGLTLWMKNYDLTQDPHCFHSFLEVDFPVNFYGMRMEFVDTTNPGYAVVTFNKPVNFYIDPDLGATSEAVNLVVRGITVFNGPVYSEGQMSVTCCDSGVDKGVFFNDTLTFGTVKRLYQGSGGGYVHFGGKATGWELFAMNGAGLHSIFLAADLLPHDKVILFYNDTGLVDLNGYDQTISALWANYNKTSANQVEITSADKIAVLHLENQANTTSGQVPFRFTGKAGVEFKIASGKTVQLMNGVSRTKGPLITTGAGTLRICDSGRWYGSGKIQVGAGTTLSAEVADAFGDSTEGYKANVEVGAGASLQLDVSQTVKSLTVGNQSVEPGTYYAAGSGQAKTLGCISGSGSLTVLSLPASGSVLIFK